MLGFHSGAEVFTYLTAVCAGMASLFAYNAFVSAPAYMRMYYIFASKVNEKDAKHPTLWSNVSTYMMVVLMIPNLISQVSILLPIVQRSSILLRFLGGMAITIFSIILIPLCTVGYISEVSAFVVLMCACAISGGASGYFGSSMYAFFGALPAKFTGGVLFGAGLSGSITSIIQIIMLSTMDTSADSVQRQGWIYFGIGAAVVLISMLMILMLRTNAYAVERLSFLKDTNKHEEELNKEQQQSGEVEPISLENGHSSPARRASVLKVIGTIWPLMATVAFNFCLTLIIFPTIGILVDKTNAFYATMIIATFNFADTIGRFCCNIRRIWPSHRLLYGLCFGRIILLVLYLLCIYPQDNHIIPGKAVSYILMALVGFSNGFVGSILMVYGPSSDLLVTENERLVAGSCMSLSLLSGLSVGSLLALPIVANN